MGKIAVVSPSFAAPGVFPEIHEQAVRRLQQITGMDVVEYPTTRKVGASPEERASDIHAAFADPEISAVMASIGGSDQITVVPHLEPAHPKPFFGYSDNTNILNWLWLQGIPGFYGGSTQVQLGAGPEVDEVHEASLLAALRGGQTLEITEPGVSEDFGVTWDDPRSLSEFGEREATEPWTWAGPARRVEGPTWGGCVEVLNQILVAGRFPTDPAALEGHVLLLETSERLTPAGDVAEFVRSIGERGILAAVDAVLVARPPTSALDRPRTPGLRAQLRKEQRDAVLDVVARYNPEAVTVVGIPFGHTRPQWILPYGGKMTIDGGEQRVWAHY